jgi:hypothetical protein
MLSRRAFLRSAGALGVAVLAGSLCPRCDAGDFRPGEFVCTQAIHDQGRGLQALQAAVAHDPSNAAAAEGLAQLGSRGGVDISDTALNGRRNLLWKNVIARGGLKWKSGWEIPVGFIGGTAFAQGKVEQYARQWEPFTGVRFAFGAANPLIRISFDFPTGTGDSAIGSSVLASDPSEATMHLGIDTSLPEETIARLVLHEFGHALGASHEQQHPFAHIPWNRPVVYDYYMRRGWTKETIDANVLNPEPASNRSGTYDPASIMHYRAPAFLLTDASYAVGYNTMLSPQDKLKMAQMYLSRGYGTNPQVGRPTSVR